MDKDLCTDKNENSHYYDGVILLFKVQFGHAGACANAEAETASAKNQALTDAKAYVPKSFDELGTLIKYVYQYLEIFDCTFIEYLCIYYH